MKKLLISLMALMMGMAPLSAGPHTKGMFTLNLTGSEAIYGAFADTLVSQLDSMLPASTFSSTLTYMADSQATATRGLGVTYATNHDIFVASASVNAAVSTGPTGLAGVQSTGLSSMGIGVQSSAAIGLSLKVFNLKPLGFFDPSRLNIFANFMAFNLPLAFGGTTLDIGMNAFGLHLQYKLIDKANLAFGLLVWDGLNITTGFDVASNSLGVPMSAFLQTQTTGTGPADLAFTPKGNLSITNSTFTIPIEVSTSVRVLYVLSLIGGAAVDINTGNSKLDIGTFDITTVVGGANVGTLSTNDKASAKPGFVDVRFFFGPQINLIPSPSGKNILSFTALGSYSTTNAFGLKLSLNAGF